MIIEWKNSFLTVKLIQLYKTVSHKTTVKIDLNSFMTQIKKVLNALKKLAPFSPIVRASL